MKTLTRAVAAVGTLVVVLDLADRYMHRKLASIAGVHIP